MDKELIKKMYDIRVLCGKRHIFHSTNKLVEKIEKFNHDKIYVHKDYLRALSFKKFGDDGRILDFLSNDNHYIRLALAEDLCSDLVIDLVQELKEDVQAMKKLNSSIFKDVKEKLNSYLEEGKELTEEDEDLLKKYFENLTKVFKYLRFFDFYSDNRRKLSYVNNVAYSYSRFFKNFEKDFEEIKENLKIKI